MNKRYFVRRSAALLVAAAFGFISQGAPPKAQAAPSGFIVEGCPLLGTRTLAAKIFGSYEFSGSGSTDVLPDTLKAWFPKVAGITACLFARKIGPHQDLEGDGLYSGFGQVANSAALSETWKSMKSRLGLQETRLGVLHIAEKPGYVAGYRDGQNMIAFTFWLTTMHDPKLMSVPGSRLRPFVTTFVCAGNKC